MYPQLSGSVLVAKAHCRYLCPSSKTSQRLFSLLFLLLSDKWTTACVFHEKPEWCSLSVLRITICSLDILSIQFLSSADDFFTVLREGCSYPRLHSMVYQKLEKKTSRRSSFAELPFLCTCIAFCPCHCKYFAYIDRCAVRTSWNEKLFEICVTFFLHYKFFPGSGAIGIPVVSSWCVTKDSQGSTQL